MEKKGESMMPKLFWKNYKKLILAAIGIIAAGITIYFAFLRNQALMAVMKKLVRILLPFLVGGVIAYILSPVCSFLERHLETLLKKICSPQKSRKLAHTLSSFGTMILFFLGFSAFLWLLIPQLYDSIYKLTISARVYGWELYNRAQPLLEWLNENMEWLGLDQELSASQWAATFQGYIQKFMNSAMLDSVAGIASSVTRSVATAGKVVVNILVSVIVSFYCLNSRKKFMLQGRKLIYATFSRKWAEEILYRFAFANRAFSGFVSGRILDSAIIGCICFVGCSLMKITYAPLIAVIVGVTNVIPFFGPFIGAVPSAILVLLENPIQALYFIIFVVLLQQFDGNILGPHILSSAVGVSSFWVLFSILLFGGLWGVPGMILGTPLFAVIYDIIKDWVDSRLKQKGLPTEAYRYNPELSTQFTMDEAIPEESGQTEEDTSGQ